MIRTIAFIARRPDLARASFRAHYEERHAPLARPLLDGLRHYVRNHLAGAGDDDLGFDAISEFEYASDAEFEAMRARLASAEGDAVRADELAFMHKPGNSFFASTLAGAGGAARPPPGDAGKAIALVRARRGETRAALRARCLAAARALEDAGFARATRVDVACDGDPLGAPRFDALLHAWSPDGGSDALRAALDDALDDALEGARVVAVEERGEARAD
ncbi:MAG: EthD domain-containing protein [Myxococcota bacterium]